MAITGSSEFIIICIVLLSVMNANALSTIQCGLDKKITMKTFPGYVQRGEIGSIFASACGRNRGIFVTDPPDGHTYNCASFPVIWNTTDANAIKTDSDVSHAISTLNSFIQSVYASTPNDVRAKDPGACDFEAMSAYTCGKEDPWKFTPWHRKLRAPIRSVTINGLFIIKSWITPGLNIANDKDFGSSCSTTKTCDVIRQHWDNFYSQEDFDFMATHGINTVRIPIGYWFFTKLSGYSSTPYVLPVVSIKDLNHPLTKIISAAKLASLHVILALEPIDDDNDVEALAATEAAAAGMAKYVEYIETKFALDNVIILELGTTKEIEVTNSIEIIRDIRPLSSVIVRDYAPSPMTMKHIYHGREVLFATSVADIASDTPMADREKMFAHEKIACSYKAPLHFGTCTKFPVFVYEFSLATENCLPGIDPDFKDFGQCAHISERVSSPWWHRHTQSFAMRQIDTFEHELGWSFSAFKLDDLANMDESAVYWSFKKAVLEGYINLSRPSGAMSENDACIFGPEIDFILGDDSVAPSAQPMVLIPPNAHISPPVAASIHSPVIAPVVPPITASTAVPVAAPVAIPVFAPVAPPVVVPVVAPVIRHKATPVTAPMVNPRKEHSSNSSSIDINKIKRTKSNMGGTLVILIFGAIAAGLLAVAYMFIRARKHNGYRSIISTITDEV